MTSARVFFTVKFHACTYSMANSKREVCLNIAAENKFNIFKNLPVIGF